MIGKTADAFKKNVFKTYLPLNLKNSRDIEIGEPTVYYGLIPKHFPIILMKNGQRIMLLLRKLKY